MSSTSGSSHSGGDNENTEADASARNEDGRVAQEDEDEGHETPGDESEAEGEDLPDITSRLDDQSEEDAEGEKEEHVEEQWSGVDDLPSDDPSASVQDHIQPERRRPESPDDLISEPGPVSPQAKSPLAFSVNSASIPDDTISQAGSLLSSSARGASPISRKAVSRSASAALQPFERRFEARPSVSRSSSVRNGSPAFLSPHSRQISISSQISQISSQADSEGTETAEAPWDVVRWTKLKKITNQAFSEAGKRNFGRPTCLAVSALIAIGTSRGLVLGFDYHQTLKVIIGQGTKATECGSVTALAIAADYSTIAVGHANGHIFTWEISRPSQPFLRVPPLERSVLGRPNHPDGHVATSAILHIGFLGTRHTALVSADSSGMAFSHLATRGLGPVTRTPKTTRLLGRYPSTDVQTQQPRKPSSVLACSPLPLGNVEQPTDRMGLTALLTPYLLVIVSTTPVAQTQYKSPRPKGMSPHGALSGCLAWFPAVQLKTPGTQTNRGVSEAKLVYCWSNVMTVLDVKIVPNDETADSNKPPDVRFQPRGRWRAEEAIVAVQWLGRSVLAVLTISQRLLIFEDGSSLQVTDSMDLLHRHIYHQDLFSQQLQRVVEQHASDPSSSPHGVVADAFYMSFRAYKGRTFLLGLDNLAFGALSNWADRLMALMEAGDHMAAIRLATAYHRGGAHNVTVGLPDDEAARHRMVRERLRAMLAASLPYTFAQHDAGRTARLRELATACVDACIAMREPEYLFGPVWTAFDEGDEAALYMETLEPYVLDGEIDAIPPEVVKEMVAHWISENQAARLEELLCRLDPHAFDLDEMTVLCRQHRLYDALIYVWTQAMGDFVTPLVDLLSLVQMLLAGDDDEDWTDNPLYDSAMKAFPYLAYSLTGRRYPGGAPMDDDDTRAQADLYGYLFSGRPRAWPPESDQVFRTSSEPGDEPAFPYLVLLLRFDVASFMSMMNEAFEDAFLNNPDDDVAAHHPSTRDGGGRPGSTMTRQHVVSILLDVMTPAAGFGPHEVVYLDMFVARSLPKYPGQLVLSGSLLDQVLHRLCRPPTDALRDDCQLSVEYLLSTYRPPARGPLIAALRAARFFRVLKSTYRAAAMYPALIETYFDDPADRPAVFDCIAHCLRPSPDPHASKRARGVHDVVAAHLPDLHAIDSARTAATLARYAPDLLERGVETAPDAHAQFAFLRALLEPSAPLPPPPPPSSSTAPAFTERYVALMARHDPARVADYVGGLPSSDLRLAGVLPALEEAGATDAAVVLLVRDGLTRDAMVRLVAHLQRLRHTLADVVASAGASPDLTATGEAARSLVGDVEKYTRVGVWLCRGSSAGAERRRGSVAGGGWEVDEEELELDEWLWLELVDAVVQVSQQVGAALRDVQDGPEVGDALEPTKVLSALRCNVQQTFTALLSATATTGAATTTTTAATQTASSTHHATSPSFLRILRAFLARTARTTGPSLADLRAVLTDIFTAYTYEAEVLRLAHGLLGTAVFADTRQVQTARGRGWRPRAAVCEGCRRRAWGPGLGEAVWERWAAREAEKEAERRRRAVERSGGAEARRMSRGKARAATVAASEEEAAAATAPEALVVFACRHVFHRACLEGDGEEDEGGYRCRVCAREAERG